MTTLTCAAAQSRGGAFPSGRASMAGEPRHLRIGSSLAIPLEEITLRASRSSGPGGQHANVTASRVEAAFDVHASRSLTPAAGPVLARHGPRVTASAQDTRSQARNRELALERLARRLEAALHVRRPRTPTRPTAGAERRRLDAKRRRGTVKRNRRSAADDD